MCFSTVAQQSLDADLQLVRDRLVGDLLATPVDRAFLQGVLDRMDKDGTWASIDYADTSRTGFEHRIHLNYLLAMAKAYQQRDGSFLHNTSLLKYFKKALQHWLAKDYRSENWWWNEIGTPDAMGKVLLLMRDELTTDEFTRGAAIAGRSNFDGVGARPGGDFVKMAAIKAMADLAKGDTTQFGVAIKTMADQIYVTEGQGVKPDMSFHHRKDGVPSTLSYGRQYVAILTYWGDVLRGTRYAFEPDAIAVITDYYLGGMRKAMPFGRFDDPGIKNREVSRRAAPPRDRADVIAQRLGRISNYRKNELEHPNLRSNRYFWYSHYHSHQRPAYFASVRMYSNRANNIESPYNGEGLKNHFYADGSQFISRTGQEYHNIYPSWDWRKIPGTTVVQTDEFPHWDELVKKGTTSFVGGVSDGEYGAAVFDFKSPFSGLEAHKSWFFFDDEIVCLGSGISSDAPYPVMTTLNQSLRHGPVWVDGNRKTDEYELELQAPIWINHDRIGYVLLDTGQVWLKGGKSTGSWHSITHQTAAADKPVSQDLFTLSVDHGERPQGATYAYVVLPTADKSTTEAYVQQRRVEVVSNTVALQAVSHLELGVHYAVFYKPGEVTFPGGLHLKSNEPALFMVKTATDGIECIAVADPTRELETVTFRATYPMGNAPETTMTVELPKRRYAGKSLVIDPTRAIENKK